MSAVTPDPSGGPWRPRIVAALLLLLVAAPGCGVHRWRGELWLWSSVNLADSTATARTAAVWRRAAHAGYTTVVVSDLRFSRLASQDAGYFARLAAMRALADSLGWELVPAILPMGRGQGAMLAERPELAEAVPVRDALFELRGGRAERIADPPVALAARPDRVGPGIRLADGVLTARDPWLGARAAWRVAVSPWRTYHVSAEVRTGGFRGEPSIKVRGPAGELAFARLGVAATQPWTRADVVFHSLEASEVTVHLGAKAPARGLMEWRNWAIEECGPLNVVRRPGLESVADSLPANAWAEPVTDSLFGETPWRGQFTAWHAPGQVVAHAPDGSRFRLSWWEAPVLERGQVAVCLGDTLTRAQTADEIARVRTALAPRTVLLQHDEIRVLGWDPPCAADGATPGALLAAHVRFCRERLAGVRVLVWNDLFDPLHNALPRGWLVHGSLAGSIAGLDTNVVVVNWNHARMRESLAWFEARGHRQVWAGYYDRPLRDSRRELRRLGRTPGVFAVMYTTWRDQYDDLEAFARIAREGR